MSSQVVRCAHCGNTHDAAVAICPLTNRPMRGATPSAATLVPAQLQSTPPPFPPARKPPPLPVRSSSPPPAQHPSSLPPPSVSPHSSNLTGTTARPMQRALIGQLIDGKYLVRGVLGEGGMGTVFEAENRALRRSVAVKVLHPTQARKKVAVKRFQQEARAAGAIGHPNICEVYDLGTLEDGSPYLVMEHLQGETLADRIAGEGGLPFDDLLDIVSQVLSGLVAAHAKGIVHRDIKPENVFLIRRAGLESGAQHAKVLDFGVSKVMPMAGQGVDEEMNLTRTGMVMGTPYYMSPEQARGDRNLDGRVDIWACGVILYEGLTGRRPFTAANYNALLLQILTTSPRPPRELRPALPPGLDAVMNKAMARAREERYQTAEEFQVALRSLRERRQSSPNYGPPPITGTVPLRAGTPPGPSKAAFGQKADPLASLPRLPTSESSARAPRVKAPSSGKPSEQSSTHIALDDSHLDSVEGAALAPVPPGAPLEFDDAATEIRRPEHMEIGEMRARVEAATAKKRAARAAADKAALEALARADAEAEAAAARAGRGPIPSPLLPLGGPQATDWDDVTTRLDPRRQMPPFPPAPSPPSAERRVQKRPPPTQSFEDTVKIEGDLEAHFAEELRKSKER